MLAGHDVVIVGGANSAGQAALHLARYARTVTLVVRANSLRLSMSEYLVRQGPIPWSIARANQFHWLLDRMLGKMARLPIVPLPDLQVEPVDTSDFADYVVESVGKGPAGRLDDFGGPEVLTFAEAFDQWRQIRDGAERTMRVPLPPAAANAAAAMSISDPASRHGMITWAEWLRTHAAE